MVAGGSLILGEIPQCKALRNGRRDLGALDEFWKAASYEEITRARRTGLAARVSSTILEAGRVVEVRRDQKMMRCGETLSYAARTAARLDYIQSALQSGSMELPGQVIGRRFEATANWMVGDKKSRALETLDEIHNQVRRFGFAPQSRSVAALKAWVRQGARSLLPE